MAKAKPKPVAGDDSVYCPSCKRGYKPRELRTKSESGPGMKRPGGGPNGAWRKTWRCCPRGHKVRLVSFKIS